jgi:hypothetical protein
LSQLNSAFASVFAELNCPQLATIDESQFSHVDFAGYSLRFLFTSASDWVAIWCMIRSFDAHILEVEYLVLD